MPCTHGVYRDVNEALDSALFHIAQNAWDGEEGESLDALLVGLTPAKKSDLRSWALWQLRYRHAKQAGLTPDQCHRWASEHHDHNQAMQTAPVAA